MISVISPLSVPTNFDAQSYLRCDQAIADRKHDSLDAVSRTERLHRLVDVPLHGAIRDVELLADSKGRKTLGQQTKNVYLSLGQLTGRGGGAPRSLSKP